MRMKIRSSPSNPVIGWVGRASGMRLCQNCILYSVFIIHLWTLLGTRFITLILLIGSARYFELDDLWNRAFFRLIPIGTADL